MAETKERNKKGEGKFIETRRKARISFKLSISTRIKIRQIHVCNKEDHWNPRRKRKPCVTKGRIQENSKRNEKMIQNTSAGSVWKGRRRRLQMLSPYTFHPKSPRKEEEEKKGYEDSRKKVRLFPRRNPRKQ